MQVKTVLFSQHTQYGAWLYFHLKFCCDQRIFSCMTNNKTHIANKAKSDEKQARLAEALRANLRRRKTQAKEQAASDKDNND